MPCSTRKVARHVTTLARLPLVRYGMLKVDRWSLPIRPAYVTEISVCEAAQQSIKRCTVRQLLPCGANASMPVTKINNMSWPLSALGRFTCSWSLART